MVEEEHLDVLQNIEFAIIAVYRDDPSLLDNDVQDAIHALIRNYESAEGRPPPQLRLADRARRVFGAVRDTCEWRLGRQSLQTSEGAVALDSEPLNPSELTDCLRRIEKSIRRWNKQGGRQGYLNFVRKFMP